MTDNAIRLLDVTKQFAGASTPAVDSLSLDVGVGHDHGAARAVRVRQDHDTADDQPPPRADLGHHRDQRHRRHEPVTAGTPPRHRLRHPAGRPVPPPHDRQQHRHGPEDARLGQDPHGGPRRRTDDARRARARVARPISRRTVRRAATTRRCGTRAGRGSAGVADGRTVRRRRPDRAQEPAGRAPRPPGQGPQDDRARHPRRRRGVARRRSDRRHERRRRGRATGDARRPDALAGERVRRDLRRRRPRPAPVWR